MVRFESPYAYDKKKRCFVLSDTKQTMTGLLTVLEKHMWPHYTYNAAKIKIGSAKTDEKLVVQTSLGPSNVRTGLRVGREIDEVINACRAYKMSFSDWCTNLDLIDAAAVLRKKGKVHRKLEDKQAAKSTQQQLRVVNKMLKTYQMPEAVIKKQKKLHRHTRVALRALKAAGLQPVCAELPVGSATLHIATGVDIVCQSIKEPERNPFTLVELKCGFDGYRYKTTGHSLGGTTDWYDAPVNQHRMQALFTWRLFSNLYPDQGKRAAIKVLYVGREGASINDLPAELRQNAEQLWVWLHRVRLGK